MAKLELPPAQVLLEVRDEGCLDASRDVRGVARRFVVLHPVDKRMVAQHLEQRLEARLGLGLVPVEVFFRPLVHHSPPTKTRLLVTMSMACSDVSARTIVSG